MPLQRFTSSQRRKQRKADVFQIRERVDIPPSFFRLTELIKPSHIRLLLAISSPLVRRANRQPRQITRGVPVGSSKRSLHRGPTSGRVEVCNETTVARNGHTLVGPPDSPSMWASTQTHLLRQCNVHSLRANQNSSNKTNIINHRPDYR